MFTMETQYAKAFGMSMRVHRGAHLDTAVVLAALSWGT